MFADISGFTSWSSTRNPEAVLRLLECIYRAFDMIAKSQRVYKVRPFVPSPRATDEVPWLTPIHANGSNMNIIQVETIGDSYVAVAGLPDPRRDHAVAMARFARDIMAKMKVLVRKLEVVLGPDTADLQLRIGLHSGSVTGGVLRGDRARFQLFGDAMNTASRMVSTSQPGKVQLSQETTDLLIAAGKFQWIELRESTVVAKGKGEMQTYWLTLTDSSNDSAADPGYHPADVGLDLSSEICGSGSNASGRMDRLIGWNTECLLKLLRQVVAKRESSDGSAAGNITTNERHFTRFGETVIHEVKEIIALPSNKAPGDPAQANTTSIAQVIDPEDVEFSVEVVDQLYDFVSNVAAMHKPENPFHNFEHASNVVMALIKFFAKIEANAGTLDENGVDCTLGITADPLTQFACVFAALIHDGTSLS
jgi:class 3 adenylate cyclase